MGKMLEPFVTGNVAMSAVRVGDSDLTKILRGVAVIVAAALMILPAYLNYEIWKTGFNPVVSWQLACNCLLSESSSSFSQWAKSDWLQSLNLSKGVIPPGIYNR